jgi:hypothetical protein
MIVLRVLMKEFKLKKGEGAILFRDGGVEFHYPEGGSLDLRETFEFLTFAMVRHEWIAEWYEYLDAIEALEDLAMKSEISEQKKEEKPKLTLLIGGKSQDENDS